MGPRLTALAARAEREQVAAGRADAAAVLAIALVELDEGLVEGLAAAGVELVHQRHHWRRRAREELSDLLTGIGVDPERAVDELELEILAEHVLDVVLAPPFGRLAPLQGLLGEAAVELAELRVRLPGGEA